MIFQTCSGEFDAELITRWTGAICASRYHKRPDDREIKNSFSIAPPHFQFCYLQQFTIKVGEVLLLQLSNVETTIE